MHATDLPPAPAPADPLALYAGAPAPGHIPGIPALARAYAHFRSHYQPADPEHRLILDGAARAFAALQERPWTVLPDGSLEIAGSTGDTIYLVSDNDCRQKGRVRIDKRTGRTEPALCPSFLFSQRRHGGACYHVIARELLRLAQLFDSPVLAQQSAADEPGLPFITLGGRLLGMAFGIARLPEQWVTLTLAAGRLTVAVGDPPIHLLWLSGVEGAGHGMARLAAADFGELWQAFRPVAPSLALVSLFLDPRLERVLLYGDQFAARCRGVPR